MNWLTTNARLKVTALVLATGTWLFVRGITSETRVVENVPLEIRLKPGLTLVQSCPAAISVTVRGTREDIRQSSRTELSALLDLSKATRTGEWQERISLRAIRHPSHVQVADINPNVVTVRVDEMVERELPVKLMLTGELPAGLNLERTTVIPSTVRVTGPKTTLEPLKFIETLPIDLTGRRVSFRERVGLAPSESGIASLRQWVEAEMRVMESGAIDSLPEASKGTNP